MQITPLRQFVSFVGSMAATLDRIHGILNGGGAAVSVKNASIPSTQSGTWTVGVNAWTATGVVVINRPASAVPEAYQAYAAAYSCRERVLS